MIKRATVGPPRDVIGDKRQLAPLVLEFKCDNCGRGHVMDYSAGGWYFRNPVFNKPLLLTVCCVECSHEETITLRLRFGVELETEQSGADDVETAPAAGGIKHSHRIAEPCWGDCPAYEG